MVDMSAIAGMISALKGASDITKAMIGLHDAAIVQGKVIELQGKILEAQGAAFAANDERRELLEKIETLETEVRRLKNLQGGGEQCPRCRKYELRVERSTPSRIFGAVGVNDHHMKCAACDFEEVRQQG